MWCLGCGYELNGLERGDCPECGRAFDPDDPASVRTEASIQAEERTMTLAVGIGLPIGGMLGLTIGIAIGMATGDVGIGVALGLPIGSGIGLAVALAFVADASGL